MAEAKRILVVEDEFLIALDISDALEQGGLVVIGPLASVRDALAALEREHVDGALLDANLGGEPVGPLADALFARRVPFAFVSGYGREQLPPTQVLHVDSFRWSARRRRYRAVLLRPQAAQPMPTTTGPRRIRITTD